jgi:ELWxxDGT repeat protein
MDTGSELWMSDGTPEGTRLYCDCFPGPASSSPVLLASRESRFVFVADHAQYGRVLWESDGSDEGTHVLLPVDASDHTGSPLVASEAIYLEKTIVAAGYFVESSAKVHQIMALREDSGNIIPNMTGPIALSNVHSLTALEDQVFFVANDGVIGEELWKLDSAQVSASLVRDILP